MSIHDHELHPPLHQLRAERDGLSALSDLTARAVRAEIAAEMLARAIESASRDEMAAALVAYRNRER